MRSHCTVKSLITIFSCYSQEETAAQISTLLRNEIYQVDLTNWSVVQWINGLSHNIV